MIANHADWSLIKHRQRSNSEQVLANCVEN